MDALAAGRLVAQRYRLSAPLGSGTQGSVWEAVDTRRGGALCAIKFGPAGREHRAEAEVLLALSHPSLPRAFDYGAHENGTFLVLERVAGATLHAMPDPRAVMRSLADVASALSALHDAGLVHGDVKPANILVGTDRAWLVDLGLASAHGTSAPAGTLAFMAPETLVGERLPASDLYALGVTAAMILTGQHPLVPDPTDRDALLRAIASARPPRDAVLAAIQPEFRDAVRALLAPEPERRPTSARAWLARLSRDAPEALGATLRAKATASVRERPARLPLIGRDAELADASQRVERALKGGSIAGVVFVGPDGSGRKRMVDDVLRTAQIAHAAHGDVPEIVDRVPDELARATIVRLVDADPATLRSVATTIARLGRYGDLPFPLLVVANAREPLGIATIDEIALAPLTVDALGALLASFGGHALADGALQAWFAATSGFPGRAIALAQRLDVETVATATREDLARHATSVAGALPSADIVGSDAHAVSALLAAAREPLTQREISGISNLPHALAAVAELRKRGLVLARNDGVSLASPMALATLDDAARMHIGTQLEHFFATHEPARHGIRARAAVLRGDRDAAVRHADEASRVESIGPTGRIEWLQLLMDLATDRTPYALRLANEWITLGEPRRALSVLDALDPTPSVRAQRADALRRAGDVSAARDLATPLLDDADATTRTGARLVLARDALDHGDTDRADALLGPLADGTDAPWALRGRALELGALSSIARRDAVTARKRIESADEAAVEAGDVTQQARLRSLRGMLEQQHGGHRAGRAAYEQAWQLATRAGDLHGAATYAVNLGAAELECGALGDAALWLGRGARALARLGRMGDLARALGNLASLHAFVGAKDLAREQATRAEEAAIAAGDRVSEAFSRMIAAEVTLDGVAAGDALVAAAILAVDPALAADARARAAIAFARAGSVDHARAQWKLSDGAPALLRALAEVEIALVASPSDLASAMDALQRALADERTLEHELHAFALRVRVAERMGDADEARRARQVHRARVATLAASLPESLAALFTDAHALPESSQPSSIVPARATAGDARWRRLVEITRELNNETRLRALLERVMDAIVELTGAARGFLLLRAPDGTLRVRTARNIGRRDLGSDEMALSRSVAERVARSGEALLTIDASTDRRLDTFESVHAMRLRSILAVPLIVRGDVVGTIYVDDRLRTQAFGNDALEIAREFAEAAAIAIQNARSNVLLRRALHRAEHLSRALERRVEEQSVELEATRRALSSGAEMRGRYDDIIGRGVAMTRTLQLVDKVSPTAMPVLLLGESGTGKELIARAIHANSPRSARPFVAENCGAIPETLLESVLFGHVKGAFTGADRTRAGLFEVADGGTLFLDEIGEMSAPMQSKLLRVLQDGELRPLGGDRARHVDVRVIAATHRDLAEMVKQGRFREDLYYRLAVMVVPIPALRQRREDLPLLVSHFLSKHGRGTVTVDRRAMARLVAFAWPGNVRQLENEMMRACVLADGAIREDDLSPALATAQIAHDVGPRDPLDLRGAVEDLERQLIEQALRQHNGNQSRAAKALGLSRFGLQKKLKRLAWPARTVDDADGRTKDPAKAEAG